MPSSQPPSPIASPADLTVAVNSTVNSQAVTKVTGITLPSFKEREILIHPHPEKLRFHAYYGESFLGKAIQGCFTFLLPLFAYNVYRRHEVFAQAKEIIAQLQGKTSYASSDLMPNESNTPLTPEQLQQFDSLQKLDTILSDHESTKNGKEHLEIKFEIAKLYFLQGNYRKVEEELSQIRHSSLFGMSAPVVSCFQPNALPHVFCVDVDRLFQRNSVFQLMAEKNISRLSKYDSLQQAKSEEQHYGQQRDKSLFIDPDPDSQKFVETYDKALEGIARGALDRYYKGTSERDDISILLKAPKLPGTPPNETLKDRYQELERNFKEKELKKQKQEADKAAQQAKAARRDAERKAKEAYDANKDTQS